MAEVGRNAYATTGANAAAGSPNVVAVVNDGTGDRQIVILGDQTTAANMQTVKAASTAAVAGDMAAVVAIHPSTPLPAGTAIIGKVTTDQTTHGTTDLVAADITKINGTAVSTANPLPSSNSDGTNIANVLKNDGTAAGQNALLVAPNYIEKAGLSAAALNADLLAATDISNTPFVKLAINATAFSGTLSFQGSNDNFTTVYSVILDRVDTTTGVPQISTTAASTAWAGYVPFRYFRIRMTAYVSGTAAGVVELTSNAVRAAGSTLVQGTSAEAAALSGNPVRVGGTDGSLIKTLAVTTGGALKIDLSSAVANATAGLISVKIDQTTPGTTNLVQVGGSLPTGTNTVGSVNVATKTTGGATTYTLISAATTNAQFIKASAGTLYGVQASNTGAAVAFLKIFNKASAPTVGTDVAVKTLIIPAGGGIVWTAPDFGTVFGTGIAIAITGLATTADTTAVALAQVVINADYA